MANYRSGPPHAPRALRGTNKGTPAHHTLPLLPTNATQCCRALQSRIQCVQSGVDCPDGCAAEDADAKVWVQPQQLLYVGPYDVVALDKPVRGSRCHQGKCGV